jgi:hypothetical protein
MKIKVFKIKQKKLADIIDLRLFVSRSSFDSAFSLAIK